MIMSREMNTKSRKNDKLKGLGFQILAGLFGAAIGLIIIKCLLTAMV